MANVRETGDVHGVYWREDRQAWAARYKINGKLVRKVFGPADLDRQNAVDWLEDARSLKRKEGAASLPVSATQPILTMAEKKVLREEQADRVTLAELCDDLKAYIKKHPSQYKDQVNPPQRLDRIKAEIGDRQAAGMKPTDIEEWLDGLKNLHAQRGRGKPVADATYNRYRVTLSSVYKRGIKTEKVAENPVKGTSQRKLDNNVIRWLKPHEEKSIRAAITKRIETCTQEGQTLNAKHELHHQCEFIVSIQTGMRAEEQFVLEWPDIDLSAGKSTSGNRRTT